jgi:M6 family metalloprotease-like protein
MKKLLIFLFILVVGITSYAAPFSYLPHQITQPDGEVISCFVSGDEFFNWIHDQAGYTIIQAPDGFYYYAETKQGKITPSAYRVNKTDPEKSGLKKWAKISKEEYNERRKSFEFPSLKSNSTKSAHTGTINNLVIYIRFADDTEISTTRKTYDDRLNPPTGISLKAYYTEVSYNQLTINSTHYPVCDLPATTNTSYQDTRNRNYYKKYNETTNPTGYQTDEEKKNREHQLLADAVAWVNQNAPVSTDLNIDSDNDGLVDNVCFMIKGNAEGWNDLLWAHRWALFTKNISINGKRVYDYTFQPENQVSVKTLCHEMFHVLGAPDLYHYDKDLRNLTPVGAWDLMESGGGHMGAYMKFKYANGKWIANIPEITESGTYTLNPIINKTNNCFKIASPNSADEFFVVEYRKRDGIFEADLPGDGLVVYRINKKFRGNSGFNNTSIFDEVYIYRPGGTHLENGNIRNAHLSFDIGRTAINDAGDPKSYLSNGLPAGLDIKNVGSAGATISFDVLFTTVKPATNFKAETVASNEIKLTWAKNTDLNDVVIVWSTSNTIGSPLKGVAYGVGTQIPGGGTVLYTGNALSTQHGNLQPGSNYFYRIWSKSAANVYSTGATIMGSTMCVKPQIPLIHGFNGDSLSPCWKVVKVASGNTEEEEPAITVVNAGTNPTASPYEGSHMIKFNSTYCGAGNVLRLVSPSFSTNGQTRIAVNFAWHRDTQWEQWVDFMTIQWSEDGTNWKNGPKYNRQHTTTGWTLQSYELPQEAMGKESIQIGFEFTSVYGYNCYLDDIQIKPIIPAHASELKTEGFRVYPNPSTGVFTIGQIDKHFNHLLVEVHDLSGKLIYAKSYKTTEKSIDLTKMAPGIYLLSIYTEKQKYSQRIVIE